MECTAGATRKQRTGGATDIHDTVVGALVEGDDLALGVDDGRGGAVRVRDLHVVVLANEAGVGNGLGSALDGPSGADGHGRNAGGSQERCNDRDEREDLHGESGLVTVEGGEVDGEEGGRRRRRMVHNGGAASFLYCVEFVRRVIVAMPLRRKWREHVEKAVHRRRRAVRGDQ